MANSRTAPRPSRSATSTSPACRATWLGGGASCSTQSSSMASSHVGVRARLRDASPPLSLDRADGAGDAGVASDRYRISGLGPVSRRCAPCALPSSCVSSNGEAGEAKARATPLAGEAAAEEAAAGTAVGVAAAGSQNHDAARRARRVARTDGETGGEHDSAGSAAGGDPGASQKGPMGTGTGGDAVPSRARARRVAMVGSEGGLGREVSEGRGGAELAGRKARGRRGARPIVPHEGRRLGARRSRAALRGRRAWLRGTRPSHVFCGGWRSAGRGGGAEDGLQSNTRKCNRAAGA